MGMEIYFHAFLTLILDEGKWLALRSDRFTPKERVPDTHSVGGWMDTELGWV
jgi:hypothetical protein